MRIRSIKPEFWRSDDIAALPLSARLLFVGLWSYVDDNGVGSDKVSSIAADLFAADLEVDPTETFRRVSADTARLLEQGLILRYEVGGKPLLYIRNWEKHQLVKNPSKGKLYPLPSAQMMEPTGSLRRPSVDTTEALGTGTGEQGNRGTEEQGGAELENPASPPSPFCPRHQSSGGTDQPCKGCKFAATDRERWEIAQLPPGVEYVHEHNWFPDGTCATCTERQF